MAAQFSQTQFPSSLVTLRHSCAVNYHPLAFAALLFASVATVNAGTIYKWTDEQGRTHFSDSVPEKYLKSAKPVSESTVGPTSDQQREAQTRAEKEKAEAGAIGSRSPKSGAAPTPSATTSTPSAKRPDRVPDDKTDCKTWVRLYLESSDCFAPFRTVSGGTRPEAFDVCTPVDEPPSRCRWEIP